MAYSSSGGWYISAPFDSSNDVLFYLRWFLAGWRLFMDVWQMPMFFFLSGVSAFHALKRRSEWDFRKERVHRLLMPYLVLVLTNGVYSIASFSPLGFYSLSQKEPTASLISSPSDPTFSEVLLMMYLSFNAGQGWFTLTLFLFSQVNRTCKFISLSEFFPTNDPFIIVPHTM